MLTKRDIVFLCKHQVSQNTTCWIKISVDGISFFFFFFLVFPEKRVWHAIRYFIILPREAKVNYRNLICSLVTQEYGILTS